MPPTDRGAGVNRRTALKAIGLGALGTSQFSHAVAREKALSTPPHTSIRGQQSTVVFADEFEDGQLNWTDVDHPEFWSEQDGQVSYEPSTSAGSTGDNALYANATFDGEQGLLQWPVALEVKGYASHTSANLGILAVTGGPKDWGPTQREVLLGVSDNAYTGSNSGDTFQVWNSRGERFDVGTTRDNNVWYTYRLVPDLDEGVINIFRNGEQFTVPEPQKDPIGNVSIVLNGGTCWGCGGQGHRRYEYVKVTDVSSATIPGDPNCEITADITEFSVEGGTYQVGESVEAVVTVTNTGDCDHDFFVGFGVIDSAGNIYDNNATTGNAVSVAAGAAESTTVSWQIEDGIPAGQYDAVTAIWQESNPEELETRLAEVTQENAFRVSQGQGSVETVSGTVINARGQPVPDAVVTVFGKSDQQILGETTTNQSGKYSFTQWSNSDLETYRDEYETVIVLAANDSWFGSVMVGASSFLRSSDPIELPLVNTFLRPPTLVQNSNGLMLGQVTVWREVLPDRKGVLHLEVANTNNQGQLTDLRGSRYDLSSGIFSWRLPEENVAVDYGPWDDVEVGGAGLTASEVFAVATGESEPLAAYHPSTTGVPLLEGGKHYSVYRRLGSSNDTKSAEDGASRVLGTIPGLSTFASWADNLKWVFGDPFEESATIGDYPDPVDPNKQDTIIGPWNSGKILGSEEAAVVFSVPFQLTSASPIDVMAIADWKFNTLIGFAERFGTFTESYTIEPM